MNAYFHYCPRCATRLSWKTKHQGDPKLQTCPQGHYTIYNNPVGATEACIVRRGKLLMYRRARQPKRGLWDLPGGFLDGFEMPKHGVAREIREELGRPFRPKQLIGAYTDTYRWQGRNVAVTVLSYLGTLRGNPVTNDEISEWKWFPLKALPTRLAFPHLRYSLHDLRTSLART